MHARPHLSHWDRLRAAVVWDVLSERLAAYDRPLAVVDAGGGTGGFAVPLAVLGHAVTVVDPSPDSLASLERRATEEGVAGRLVALQGDVAALLDVVGTESADVVLCHSVLELVDDAAAAVAAVAAALRPGGIASLLASNRTAVVLSRAIDGRFDDATHALADPAGRWGPGDHALRHFSRDELAATCAAAGLEVEAVHGVRVFTDLVSGALLDSEPQAFEALARLERAVAADPPYRDIASQLHVLARKPG